MTPRKSGVILNNSIPSFVVIYQRNVSWHLDPIPNWTSYFPFLQNALLRHELTSGFIACYRTVKRFFWRAIDAIRLLFRWPLQRRGGGSTFFWYILFFGYLLNFILKILKIGTPETWVEQESEEHVKYLRTVKMMSNLCLNPSTQPNIAECSFLILSYRRNIRFGGRAIVRGWHVHTSR